MGSPAQRLFGRRTKTTLPTSTALLEPQIIEPAIVQESLLKNKEKQKQYFDHHTKELPVLHSGDNIRYETNTGLKPAVVVEKRKEQKDHT